MADIDLANYIPALKYGGSLTMPSGSTLTIPSGATLNIASGATVTVGTSITLTNATTNNTITIDQNDDVGSTVSTDGALHVEGTGNPGINFSVYTNIGASASAPSIYAQVDNPLFDQIGFRFDYHGVAPASSGGFYYQHAAVISSANSGGFFIHSNTNHTSAGLTRGLLKVHSQHASSVLPAALIDQDGTAQALVLSAASGAHMNLDGDPANSSPADGDLWFDGTNLKLRVGATTNNIDMTAA